MSGDDSRETSTKVVGVRRLKEAMAKPASTRIFTVANQKVGSARPPPQSILQQPFRWVVCGSS
jgi:hypothetical protein